MLHTLNCSPRSTLYTGIIHLTLHPRNLILFTLYAVWNLGLALFSCCARTPISRPQLRFCTEGPLRCRRWTFESSPITGHHAGYAEVPHPLRATVQINHVFSPSSPPTYIASILRFGCSSYLPTCPSFRPACPRWRRSGAAPFVFSCQAPCQASFRPLPLGLKLFVVIGPKFLARSRKELWLRDRSLDRSYHVSSPRDDSFFELATINFAKIM